MSDENTSNLMALTNHLMNVKDSRWLQLEVCREFQRGQCSRTELECKFAHPPPHVEVQNGRVTACYDSIKGKCTRENPKCKYLHPPQHLKDQLLINGRNTLALKNLLMNQLSTPVAAPMAVNHLAMPSASALIPGLPSAYSPYAAYALNTAAVYPGLISSPEGLGAVGGVLPAGTAASPVSMAMAVQAQKVATSRADRVEALNTPANKRAAIEKSGVPMFQPVTHYASMGGALHYPQLTAIPGLQTSYVPAMAFAGHPPSMPRF